MRHKVFVVLFVPFSLTLCGCPWCALIFLTYCPLHVYACVCAHLRAQTSISSTTHTEGLPGVGHNYCVYRCLLIMSDRPHHVCSPAVSCALPVCKRGGGVHSCRASEKPSYGVSLPFASNTYYAKLFQEFLILQEYVM